MERFTKEQITLALTCWLLSDPDYRWARTMFNPERNNPAKESRCFFRFTLSEDGFASGENVGGLVVCTFSFDGTELDNDELTQSEAMSILFDKVINGLLMFTSEYLEMNDKLAYELKDQLIAFNQQEGCHIVNGWTSSNDVLEQLLLPRLIIFSQDSRMLH
ncbi:hypothetical protein AM629_06480 [Photorhabdus heterorhabditis]|uniref:Uncharacterized protein n=1 Tax=Photorhabdus heterorhabditis TaxID=880156 RepID=A0ABR5KE05_9GAMM|nr:hypothetical protein [Photorhabdus heterorhabditis]KOY62853.1 hypothetical protein AM629_06480 [Photorhabdus heterorhabditis]